MILNFLYTYFTWNNCHIFMYVWIMILRKINFDIWYSGIYAATLFINIRWIIWFLNLFLWMLLFLFVYKHPLSSYPTDLDLEILDIKNISYYRNLLAHTENPTNHCKNTSFQELPILWMFFRSYCTNTFEEQTHNDTNYHAS